MSQQPVVQLKHLTKKMGRKTIIDNLSLDLYPGQVTGFLGPNGAGKTTTIRMMVGLIKPTSGEVMIDGHRLNQDYTQSISQVGAIVENPEMYKFMSGYQNLIHFARLQGNITKQRIEDVVKQVGLEKRIHDKVQTYSLGMRQRLGLAQAILHKPKFLILDEPTNGLDPAGIREFRMYLRKIAAEDGVSVLVSSHLLSEIELMCDRIAVIQQGKLITIRSVEGNDQHQNKTFLFEVSNPAKALKLIEEHYEVNNVEETKGQLQLTINKEQAAELNRTFVENGIAVYEITALRKTLEDEFLEMTGGEQIG
ncbi:putative ABC transporter ATP-binding protein YhcH [Thalassobacillus devorans]|uniref:ABC transporter ATP-binding protein YhcH n=1 Tax=Thalassobacillus devorans TaxID=279813 RepID=A0ABQ1NRA6_9BACI|nr:ABC transporter ATP-binding protein [Thalassobacillus devorans]NIK29123.1 ABC-2 type transport system ATP-binding protein [Thalassobacillus devorans]GGC80969.1 putative ABC transporter ATP-binding protein YhcH [Thalassobacillus devorans]